MLNENKILKTTPVLYCFFIMAFCDLVGIAVNYTKIQFEWSEVKANFLPSLVFFWFFVLSIPAAIFMTKKGRKTTVLVGLLITFLALMIPLYSYSETICYLIFIGIGIGNTILQVSVNPLLANTITSEKLSQGIAGGQFLKAIGSFLGPIVVGYFYIEYGAWQKSLLLYAFLTFLALIWLFFTEISEEKTNTAPSFANILALLQNKTILVLFIGVFCIVGIDVGMNVMTPQLLVERLHLPLERASYGSSWYFAARTLGAFLSIFILKYVSETTFFRINMLIAVTGLFLLIFAQREVFLLSLICLIAFCCASIFAIIFSFAVKWIPKKTNEIAGLLITGVAGGAIFPPLMGIATQYVGSQIGAISVVLGCALYLLFCAFANPKKI